MLLLNESIYARGGLLVAKVQTNADYHMELLVAIR